MASEEKMREKRWKLDIARRISRQRNKMGKLLEVMEENITKL